MAFGSQQLDTQCILVQLHPLGNEGTETQPWSRHFTASSRGLLLGRGGCAAPEPEWRVKHPSTSRRHCQLEVEVENAELKIVVKDLSTNGTFINGVRIGYPARRADLKDGDVLSLVSPCDSDSLNDMDKNPCCWRVKIYNPAKKEILRTAMPNAEALSAHAQTPSFTERVPVCFQIRSTPRQPGEVVSSSNAPSAVSEARAFMSRLAPELTALDADAPRGPEHDRGISDAICGLATLRLSNETEPAPEPAPSQHLETENVDYEHAQVEPAQEPSCTSAQFAVLDTNQLLYALDTLNYILKSVPGVNCVVPLAVLKELEKLQHKEDDRKIAAAGRHALRFVQSSILRTQGQRCLHGHERSSVTLQELAESCKDLLPNRCSLQSNTDDEVLACAVYLNQYVAPKMTELLTEDKGLAIKAASYAIPVESMAALMTRAARVLAECE